MKLIHKSALLLSFPLAILVWWSGTIRLDKKVMPVAKAKPAYLPNSIFALSPEYAGINNNFLATLTVDLKDNVAQQSALATAGLLCDMSERKIVWEKSLFEKFPIASLTKMMTVLLVLEDIKSGKLKWDTQVKVVSQACRVGGSSVLLRCGETFAILDLVKAAMIASGNDACYQLAHQSAGNERDFVYRMNQRAQELGMKKTRFSNCTGMPVSELADNQSSPIDLLILANEIIKYDEILDIAGRKYESIRHGRRNFVYKNHNKLVIEFENEVDGLKTGYTVRAGYCIVATSNRKGRRLVSVVLGANRFTLRNYCVADMMSNYYEQLGLGKMGEVH